MKTILIDAGHGGKDRVNIGYSGKYVEADGNLMFSLALQEYLKPYFKIKMVRTDDSTVNLNDRGYMARDCDIVISIHSDAYSTPTVGGTSVYISRYLPNNADLGHKVGLAIANTLKIAYRGTKTRNYGEDDYYAMIRIPYQLKVPYVFLIERAFHSNPTEEQKLLDEELTKDSARAMADAIIEYFNLGGDKDMQIQFKGKTTEVETLFVEKDNRNYVKVNNIYLPVADIIRALGLDFKYIQDENKVEIL